MKSVLNNGARTRDDRLSASHCSKCRTRQKTITKELNGKELDGREINGKKINSKKKSRTRESPA
jgi:hypothetical protein